MTRWAEAVELAERESLDAHAASPAYAAAMPVAAAREAVGEAAAASTPNASETLGTAVKKRVLGGTLGRWVRDIAIGVALIVAVPVTAVSVIFRQLPFNALLAEDRVQEVAPLRALRVGEDPAITPMAAGEAFARITTVSTDGAYRVRFARESKAHMRSLISPESTVLVSARDSKRTNLLDPARLIAAAADGLSEADAAWVQRVATLPLWRDADLAARASQVDVLGGRFEQPIGRASAAWDMPIPRLSEWRKLALFGVARAAWHVHRKEWTEAEAALRTVVSLGFVMVDDGGSTIEALIGRTAIKIGREGLAQLAVERGDRELAALAVAPKDVPTTPDKPVRIDRDRVLAALLDPNLSHAVRMERHFLANYLQCESVGELMFGMSDEMRHTLDEARRQLARFPSEDALLRQHEAAFESQPSFGGGSRGMLLMGAATAASAITGNPRIAACTAPLVDW